jgi:hypothetical protein
MPKGPYSPAALALMARGIPLSRIADDLDTTPTSVSRWLRGEHPAPAELYPTIAALGGRDLASHVLELIPASAVSA